MKRKWEHRLRKAVVILLVSSCVGAWASGEPRSVRDRAMVTDMMSRKHTIRLGRFLIYVTSAAEFRLSAGRIDGFAKDTIEESEAAFADRMAARDAEIRARDAADDRTGNGPGGKPVNSSLHEHAVLALWDGIASSIRFRQSNVTRSALERAPTAPLNHPRLQLDKTVCRSDEVMFDISSFDDTTALKRQATQSSAPVSIVKLVSMLP